jgi:hypothetical protein
VCLLGEVLLFGVLSVLLSLLLLRLLDVLLALLDALEHLLPLHPVLDVLSRRHVALGNWLGLHHFLELFLLPQDP